MWKTARCSTVWCTWRLYVTKLPLGHLPCAPMAIRCKNRLLSNTRHSWRCWKNGGGGINSATTNSMQEVIQSSVMTSHDAVSTCAEHHGPTSPWLHWQYMRNIPSSQYCVDRPTINSDLNLVSSTNCRAEYVPVYFLTLHYDKMQKKHGKSRTLYSCQPCYLFINL